MSDSSNLRESIEKELENLEQLRDELRLKMHLAAADARDEFDRLERRFGDVETELKRLRDHARGPLDDIGKATQGLVDELKQGYRRVRDQLKS